MGESTNEHRVRRALVRVIKRYQIYWFIGTVTLYALSIPVMVWVYPATTLTLSVMVAFGGFTSAVASLADMLDDEDVSPT